jgi:hypothetical protein
VSQVYAVDVCSRSVAFVAQSSKNATSAPPNARKVVSVEIQPAVRREMCCPASVIASVAPSGVLLISPAASHGLALEFVEQGTI